MTDYSAESDCSDELQIHSDESQIILMSHSLFDESETKSDESRIILMSHKLSND